MVRQRISFTLLRYTDKCIVNIMKGYFERNNLQLELIRHRKQFWLYSCLLFYVLHRCSCSFEHGFTSVRLCACVVVPEYVCCHLSPRRHHGDVGRLLTTDRPVPRLLPISCHAHQRKVSTDDTFLPPFILLLLLMLFHHLGLPEWLWISFFHFVLSCPVLLL